MMKTVEATPNVMQNAKTKVIEETPKISTNARNEFAKIVSSPAGRVLDTVVLYRCFNQYYGLNFLISWRDEQQL